MTNDINAFMKKFALYGVVAFTVFLVDRYDRGIGWLYAGSLMALFALANANDITSVLSFFDSITSKAS